MAKKLRQQEIQVRGELRRRITGDESKSVRRVVKRFLHKPPVVSAIDRAAFTLGVVNLVATAIVAVLTPHYFWLYYTLWIIPLFALRWHWYHEGKLNYFLYDACYFKNVLSLIACLALPTSTTFFKAVYLLDTGPLAWAILVWRNSLVFHSLDRTTTVAIHALPPLLVWCMRWYPTTGGAAFCPESTFPPPYGRVPGTPTPLSVSDPSPCAITSTDIFNAAGLYLLWQALYILKTHVLDDAKLQRDADLLTSIRWLTRGKLGAMASATLRACRALGVMAKDEVFDSETWKTRVIFWAVQFAYTLACILVAALCYSRPLVHTLFLASMFTVAAYNGSCYYFAVFSRRYLDEFAKRVQEQDAAASAAADPSPTTQPAGASMPAGEPDATATDVAQQAVDAAIWEELAERSAARRDSLSSASSVSSDDPAAPATEFSMSVPHPSGYAVPVESEDVSAKLE